MTEDCQDQVVAQFPSISFAEFLESIPPNQFYEISDELTTTGQLTSSLPYPEIRLHCPNSDCNGVRYFRTNLSKLSLQTYKTQMEYVTYTCSNCQEFHKIFSLAFGYQNGKWSYMKFGEWPPFGPPTPSRLIDLIGPDRDYFLSGRRCENQGLGVGAFTYYRRVVENQKDRIITKIIRVAEKLGANQEELDELESAKAETQFINALSKVKKGLPKNLCINGHNPLTLLHGALSEGVHDKTDQECLAIAQSVRVVLGELAERISQALKDEAELKQAVSTLLKKNP